MKTHRNRPGAPVEKISEALRTGAGFTDAITEILGKTHASSLDATPDRLPLSAVLLLFASGCPGERPDAGPCLVLNQRSRKVRQAGDLCCPGGTVRPRFDTLLARLLSLPGLPLFRWRNWRNLRETDPAAARRLALFLAAGLRESLEEMRLNPFGVRFLGPLPPQELRMFRRTIHPMAAAVSRQTRFIPNWEVERIVYIPRKSLLDPDHYGICRFSFPPPPGRSLEKKEESFPCFFTPDKKGRLLLWGATYRIVTVFLELAFGFKPPDRPDLPEVSSVLAPEYMTGSGASSR
jgi:hypothetical protein